MADQNFLMGIRAAKSGNYTEASAYLTNAVQAEPKNEEAWLLLGYCLTDQEKRRFCYQRVLELNPANEMAQISLRHLTLAGSAPQAEAAPAQPPATFADAAAEPVLAQGKKTQADWKWVGLSRFFLIGLIVGLIVIAIPSEGLLLSGRLDNFIWQYYIQPVSTPGWAGLLQTATPDNRPSSVDSLTCQAMDLMKSQDYAGAIQDWDRVIALSPQNDNAYFQRAKCYYAPLPTEHDFSTYQSSLESALQDINKAIALHPADTDYYDLRHEIISDYAYIQDLRADRAVTFEAAAENNGRELALGVTGPLRMYSTVDMAEDLIDAGQCDEGMKLLPALYEQTPQNNAFIGTIQIIQSKGYACLGDLNNAIQLATESTSNDDDLDTKIYLRALYLYQLGQLDQALQIIDQSIQKSRSFQGARYYLREAIYIEQGKTDQAVSDLDTGQMYTWDRGDLYCYVNGELALAAGDKASGIEWLQQAEATLYTHSNVLRQKIIHELAGLGAAPMQDTPSVSLPGLILPTPTPASP